MLPAELTDYICGATSASFAGMLAVWMDENPAFSVFLTRYLDKIRAKVRGAKSDSDLQDLLWELEMGHLLSKNPHFEVEYEPYGTGNFRSPDYRITCRPQDQFNVEARRIREGASQSRFEAWEREMRDAIHRVPSQVGVALNIPVMNPSPDLLNQLELCRERIMGEIGQRIDQGNVELTPGQSNRHTISGFEKVMYIEVTKPRSKAKPNGTSYYGGAFPIWHTQREFTKFGDIVSEKLGQLRSGMPNVLAVGSRSITHEQADCEDAIGELSRLASTRDDSFFTGKGFKGTADFLAQLQSLSAIVFRSSWRGQDGERNFVWRNPRAAYSLPDEMLNYFGRMDSAVCLLEGR